MMSGTGILLVAMVVMMLVNPFGTAIFRRDLWESYVNSGASAA